MKLLKAILSAFFVTTMVGPMFAMDRSLEDLSRLSIPWMNSPEQISDGQRMALIKYVNTMTKENRPLSSELIEFIVRSFNPNDIRASRLDFLLPVGVLEHEQAGQVASGLIKRYKEFLESPIEFRNFKPHRFCIEPNKNIPVITHDLVSQTEKLAATLSHSKETIDIFSDQKKEDGSESYLHMLRCQLPGEFKGKVDKVVFSSDSKWLCVTNTEAKIVYFELPVKYLTFDLTLAQILFIYTLHDLTKDISQLFKTWNFSFSMHTLQNMYCTTFLSHHFGSEEFSIFTTMLEYMLNDERKKRTQMLSSEKTIASDDHIPGILWGYLSKTELCYLKTDLVLIPSVRIKKKICKGLIELLKIEWPEKDYSSYDCSVKKFRNAHPPQSVRFLKTAYIDKVNENIRALAQELESYLTLCEKGNMNHGNPIQRRFVTIISDAFEETRLCS